MATVPRFWWLRVTGQPGVDDMGLAPPARHVVSARVLDVLRAHAIAKAEVVEHRHG